MYLHLKEKFNLLKTQCTKMAKELSDSAADRQRLLESSKLGDGDKKRLEEERNHFLSQLEVYKAEMKRLEEIDEGLKREKESIIQSLDLNRKGSHPPLSHLSHLSFHYSKFLISLHRLLIIFVF